MSTVLITRPQEEATATAEKLERMGHRVVTAPMIAVDPVSFEIPDEGRSLIVTSKNGARHGLANIGNKERPIFAVGEATADIARQLGFTNVTVGPGTAREMIPTLLECGISEKRKYTHLAGNVISYNIADVLRGEGIDADYTVTYQTRAVRTFSLGVQEALDEGEIDYALFYSPRTATIFEEAVADYERSDWLQKMNALALSTRVADCLIGPWRTVNYAIIPTEKALFSLIG
ncbi:uroporphyrinogen-III synthase [Kordiimonas marina]|uniref:uroporphyrinogen-III synthase n=1 Tax=Kordiimonas marina TaxID=2872312 RepID=UPI001FF10090|nr:uroporphyrinogen-III synthase [Kordiimonas marina]MCJ9430601.1 uroporphyrinogen-III synthase [Kordiimonas marina]